MSVLRIVKKALGLRTARKVGDLVRHKSHELVGRVVKVHENKRGDVEVEILTPVHGERFTRIVTWFGENLEDA